MTILEKLRNAMRGNLEAARNKRAQAITLMNVADAEMLAYGSIVDAIDREIENAEKQRAEQERRLKP